MRRYFITTFNCGSLHILFLKLNDELVGVAPSWMGAQVLEDIGKCWEKSKALKIVEQKFPLWVRWKRDEFWK